MEIRSDFHVHTSFCDGRDTPAEMAETAARLGFHTLGFTGHSADCSGLEICMDDARAAAYRSEIGALKEKYRGQMHILCGLELDYNSDAGGEDYDYIIGSVHNLLIDGKYRVIDHTADSFSALLREHFDGSFDRLAEQYYACAADVLRKTKGDIIGHLDLIMKFSDSLQLAESSVYLRYAFEAIHTLIPYGKPFEINVGAITRGYRRLPYPSDALLREICACGGSIMFTGDCHDRRFLGKGFDAAIASAKRCGFKSYVDWNGTAFAEFPLL